MICKHICGFLDERCKESMFTEFINENYGEISIDFKN